MFKTSFKKLLLLLLAGFIGKEALAQKVAPYAREGEVVIKGTIGNVSPPKQIWLYMGNEKWDTVVVKNGEFEYRKKTMLPAYGAIMVKYQPGGSFFSNMSLQNTFFEAGEMHINSDTDSIKNAVFSGPAATMHNQFQAYWKKEGAIVRNQRNITAELNAAPPEKLQSADYMADYEHRMEATYAQFDSLIEAQIRANPDSFVSMMAFGSYLRRRAGNLDTAKAKSYIGFFSDDILRSGFGEKAEKALAASSTPKEVSPVPNAQATQRVLLGPGDAAPGFSQASLSGLSLSLSDFRDRYVLLDFWASWCVPCRKVNPDLVKLYDKHKGANFEILGISLDSDHQKWEEAIQTDRLSWPQVSDLKGWKNEVAALYGIRAIPQSFLIDPQGKIVAKNPKVEELDKKLEELLK